MISVFLYSFFTTIEAAGTWVLDNISLVLGIKRVMGYLTVPGMIALYLGVPTVVIAFLINKLRKI